ncbi:tryptophan--tRNA ligase [Candidatus Gracilibacteria bacterium]|nr:tryptophan--tRNA ligase [Candidatus Gracilibacteria bacterium]
MKRYLSGMQPSGTGNPHLGNYLGAMRQHVASQDIGETYYFLANYHALTSTRDREQLEHNTLSLAMDYLALGINPDKTAFFLQSDVPEVTELTWILNTVTPMGLLERAHAWKDAKQKGKKGESAGLFDYPVLMAADILIYKPDIVPVGQDQKQHVEIAADIAGYFNNTYGEVFKMPEALITKDVATVQGTDGQKMSKSYGNVIDIFAPEGVMKKQVMSIKTDSKDINEPKVPEECLPYKLIEFFVSDNERNQLAEDLRKGGMGYGTLKTKLLEALLKYFAQAREKRLELEKKQDFVMDVLAMGAKKAHIVADETMRVVREKTGIIKTTR